MRYIAYCWSTGRIEIAEILGRRPQDLWPTRYTVEGRPVLRVIWMKSNAVGGTSHGQKRRAA